MAGGLKAHGGKVRAGFRARPYQLRDMAVTASVDCFFLCVTCCAVPKAAGMDMPAGIDCAGCIAQPSGLTFVWEATSSGRGSDYMSQSLYRTIAGRCIVQASNAGSEA
jgi:hypothetical protein